MLDQVGCMYQPYVMGAMAGQDIAIRNSDPFMHNVHAMPKVSGNEGFNLAQVVKGQTNKKKFNNQEVLLRVQCDVHPWMFAYIGVTDNPYYAVTDKDGKFTIKDLPPGKYTLEAVHPKAGKKSQQITVGRQRESRLISPCLFPLRNKNSSAKEFPRRRGGFLRYGGVFVHIRRSVRDNTFHQQSYGCTVSRWRQRWRRCF